MTGMISSTLDRFILRRLLNLTIALILFLGAGDAFALTHSPSSFKLYDSKGGTLVIGAEQARIEPGELFGSVVVLWGHLDVAGQVDDLVLVSGSVTFQRGAKLTKSLTVLRGQFSSDDGADIIAEKVVFQAPGGFWLLAQKAASLWQAYYQGFIKFWAALGFGFFTWFTAFVTFLIFPELKLVWRGLYKEWPKNFLMATLGSFLVPVMFVSLVISVIGIPLVPFYLLFLLIAAFYSYVIAADWVGMQALKRLKDSQKAARFALPVGLFLLQVLWVLDVGVSYILAIGLWTVGWGAFLRSIRRAF